MNVYLCNKSKTSAPNTGQSCIALGHNRGPDKACDSKAASQAHPHLQHAQAKQNTLHVSGRAPAGAHAFAPSPVRPHLRAVWCRARHADVLVLVDVHHHLYGLTRGLCGAGQGMPMCWSGCGSSTPTGGPCPSGCGGTRTPTASPSTWPAKLTPSSRSVYPMILCHLFITLLLLLSFDYFY